MSDDGNIMPSSDREKQIPTQSNLVSPENFIAGIQHKIHENNENNLTKNMIDKDLTEEEKKLNEPKKDEKLVENSEIQLNFNNPSTIEEVKEETQSSNRSSLPEFDTTKIKKSETRKAIIRFFIGLTIALIAFLWIFVIFVLLGYQFS